MTLKLETLRELLRQSTNDVSERYFEQMLEAIALGFLNNHALNDTDDLAQEAIDQEVASAGNCYSTVKREGVIINSVDDPYGLPFLKISYNKEFFLEYEDGGGEIPDSVDCSLSCVNIEKITLNWFENEFEITGFDSVRRELIMNFLQE